VSGPLSSPVVALGSPGGSNTVFGAVFHNAFTGPSGEVIQETVHEFEWTALGNVPAGEEISAVEAHDSTSVLAGTASGRLFRIQLGGPSTELSFDEKPGQQIGGIASDGATIACFTQPIIPVRASPGVLYVGQLAAQPLTRLNPTLGPFNTGSCEFRAIAANRNAKWLGLTFALVANENEVWVSNSPPGVIWHKWVDGLPAAVRVSDIVFSETLAGGELWLSTYGRGVWWLQFS
jgi:hypothetical protein